MLPLPLLGNSWVSIVTLSAQSRPLYLSPERCMVVQGSDPTVSLESRSVNLGNREEHRHVISRNLGISDSRFKIRGCPKADLQQWRWRYGEKLNLFPEN